MKSAFIFLGMCFLWLAVNSSSTMERTNMTVNSEATHTAEVTQTTEVNQPTEVTPTTEVTPSTEATQTTEVTQSTEATPTTEATQNTEATQIMPGRTARGITDVGQTSPSSDDDDDDDSLLLTESTLSVEWPSNSTTDENDTTTNKQTTNNSGTATFIASQTLTINVYVSTRNDATTSLATSEDKATSFNITSLVITPTQKITTPVKNPLENLSETSQTLAGVSTQEIIHRVDVNSTDKVDLDSHKHFHGIIKNTKVTDQILTVAFQSELHPTAWLLEYGHQFQNLVLQAVANDLENSTIDYNSLVFIESPIQGVKCLIASFALKSENGSYMDQDLLISGVKSQKLTIEHELQQKILKIKKGMIAAEDPLLLQKESEKSGWTVVKTVLVSTLFFGVVLFSILISRICSLRRKRLRKVALTSSPQQLSGNSFESYGQNLSPDEECMKGEEQEMTEINNENYDNWVTPSPNEAMETQS